MVIPGRFELPAYRLGGGRSIQLSYGTMLNSMTFSRDKHIILFLPVATKTKI